MMALAIVVLGLFSLGRLGVDLLPEITYPEIRVRVMDPGVPATIMEDQVTRRLEEQLAITEDAVAVQSQSSEGRSSVDLSFAYGKDIDVALRDASTRLDRAKRSLPDSIRPPIIFKRDPSQLPVLELAVSSPLREPRELRTWVDYVFSKQFLTLPGVASTSVGGGPVREILVMPDQRLLAAQGLSIDDLVDALRSGNQDSAGGALRMEHQQIGGRMAGRFESVEEIAALPIEVRGNDDRTTVLRLQDVAEVVDSQEDERLRVRLDGVPGIKLTIQKQPQANTVSVVDAVNQRLELLRQQGLIPADIEIRKISDQAIYIRQAIGNAVSAGLGGTILAMMVVYVFLGDLRRTLIIGSSIPFGAMVAMMLMDFAGLTLNIMTLGGLALGVGLLVDNTIVMLENIYRHQRQGEPDREAAVAAAAEVNSAVVASTSTNLAAVLPFLFVGGLVGLLFRELIITISAAITASLLIALTLVPALGARVPVYRPGALRRGIDSLMEALQNGYASLLGHSLRAPWLVPALLVIGLVYSIPVFQSGRDVFLPELDTGNISVYLLADVGTSLDDMDAAVARLERLFLTEPEVERIFSQIGGFVYGRTEYQATNRSRISLQLVPARLRKETGEQWIERIRARIDELRMVGIVVWLRSRGIRGIRLGRGDESVSIRIQGPSLERLADIGDDIVARLRDIEGIRNLRHSLQVGIQELSVRVDRQRAAALGVAVEDVGRALKIALQGVLATDFIDGDRMFDVRVRLPQQQFQSPRDLETIVLFPTGSDRAAVHLGDVASIRMANSPARITRDQQQRMVEISARLKEGATLGEVMAVVERNLADLRMPTGYVRYDGGAMDTIRNSRTLSERLLVLALFLVLVVMAVQYESLRNPLVILISVPFAAIGVAAAISHLELPLSMPMWLGMIMLSGIVVNNAIVLVEYIEIERRRGMELRQAIVAAGRLRLRPILMTTLTTVVGMAPLAAGIGEGAEMLQPLAITIVWGLLFSTVVTLFMIPSVYRLSRAGQGVTRAAPRDDTASAGKHG